MIYDSKIWKEELKTKTDEFKKLLGDTEFSMAWYNEIEEDDWTASYKLFIEFQKYCFYSSVISRKFIESNRLSDELITSNYSIKYFKKKSDKILTKDNYESLEEEYDIENELQEDLTPIKICHLFIHSFLFRPKLIDHKINEELPDDNIENWEIDGVMGLFINTDFTKDRKVYYFELELIFQIFEDIYEDDILFIQENRVTNEIKRSKYLPEDYKQTEIEKGHNKS